VKIELDTSPPAPTPGESSPRDASRWFGLSVAALGLSGALAVVLLVGRVVALAPSSNLDVDFARRALVVHVNHAVIVWFLAFIAGLFHLIPGARPRIPAGIAVAASSLGIALFTIRGFGRREPLLSNYVPTFDDPLFLAGLALFTAGVTLTLIDRRLFLDANRADADGRQALLPPTARDAVRGSALAYFLALLTIGGAYLTLDPAGSPLIYYERLFWGGGHVFQVACVLAMLAVWSLLLVELTGAEATSRRQAVAMYALLLWPVLFGPAVTLTRRSGTLFTRMMQWGIFPVVSIILICTAFAMARSRHKLRGRLLTPAFTALATSMALTIAGFLVGALSAAPTTLVPAHYHLSIGAVTVSFMGGLFVLMPRLGWPVLTPRVAAWQPPLYGVGQAVFAVGLAVAGFWGGASRKTYGGEQPIDRLSQTIGFAAAGVGGLVAMACGVLFVVIVARGVLAARSERRSPMDRADPGRSPG
jgi:hypothetical protein